MTEKSLKGWLHAGFGMFKENEMTQSIFINYSIYFRNSVLGVRTNVSFFIYSTHHMVHVSEIIQFKACFFSCVSYYI
jgi:hypothetical protein